MEIIHRFSFFVDYSYCKEISEFFRRYDIEVETPKKGRTSEASYLVPITLNNKINMDTLKEIYIELKQYYPHVGEAVFFHFKDKEYEQAPLFELCSTGNSQKAFLDDKGSDIEWKSLCSNCDLKFKQLESPLVINTGHMKDRYMVNVDTDYWVASEKMAVLMEDWKITGYELEEVIHKGDKKNKQPAYQVKPTHTLPAWSSEMKQHHFVHEDEQQWICQVCGIRGKINYPYHYNQSDLKDNMKDINIMKEWTINGQANGWAYHPVFFSKRFRDLLIEHKITRDVRSEYAKNYSYKDWFFKPIIVVDK